MFDKLDAQKIRYEQLEAQLADAEVIQNQELYTRLVKEHSSLSDVVAKYAEYAENHAQIADLGAMVGDDDPDIAAMAKEELAARQQDERRLIEELKFLLLPRDPNDDRNVVLEIRAGTGGDEAALFGADLWRMYTRYAERAGFAIERLGSNITELGGVKELTLLISGKGAYARLKYESGVHRVQRVPETETSGRIHTSAATVAVLPEAEDVEVEINQNDLRIDTYRASGAGGQHVNRTDSAIRITHLPTGLVVTSQDQRSQVQNREQAMRVLKSRLYELEREQKSSAYSEQRRLQVGTGDRSERIRTYNFPQGRVTDHRIGLTLYKIDEVIGGNLSELIDALTLADQEARIEKEFS
jgi:peptide chain release factor 1